MRAKNSQRGCAKNRVKVPFFTNQKKLVKTRWNILHDKLSEKFTFCCQLLWGNFSNGSKSTIVCSVPRYQNFFVNMILNDDTQNFLVGLWVFDLSGSLEWYEVVFCPLSEKRWMTKKWLGKASYVALVLAHRQACFWKKVPRERALLQKSSSYSP